MSNYDPTTENLALSYRTLLEHADGPRFRIVFLEKQVRYEDGRTFRSLVIRKIDQRSGRPAAAEMLIPATAIEAYRLAADLFEVDEAAAPLAAPAAPPPAAPSQPRVLPLDDMARRSLRGGR